MAFQIDITWPVTGERVASSFTISGSYWDDGVLLMAAPGDHRIVCTLENTLGTITSEITFTPGTMPADWSVRMPSTGTLATGVYTLTAKLFVPFDGAVSAIDTEVDITVAVGGYSHAPIEATFTEV